MSHSSKSTRGLSQIFLIITTVVLVFGIVVMVSLLIFKSRLNNGNNPSVTPIPSPSYTPAPTTRMDITEYEQVYKSENFPLEITIPPELGKAKVFVTNNPLAKGLLNRNGVMELVTFENSDMAVGIMLKLFNEEFLTELERFDYTAQMKYTFVVSQYIEPTGEEVNPKLLERYKDKFGTFHVRAYGYMGDTQFMTITVPSAVNKRTAISQIQNLIQNIKILDTAQ